MASRRKVARFRASDFDVDLRKIRESIQTLADNFNLLASKLSNYAEQQDEVSDDHERRLRKLEAKR